MAVAGRGNPAPPVGARVVTADDAELGTVKEVSGDCFAVDAPLAPDYWLAGECVAAIEGDVVRLRFANDELGEQRSDGPAHSGLQRHDTILL